jgi:putative membrane protein (TIGR04086 family)
MRKNIKRGARRIGALTVMRSAFSCLAIIFVCFAAFSFVASYINVPEGAMNIMSSLALCGGCFAAAFSVSNKRRRRGLFTGAVCGMTAFLLILVLGLVFVRRFTYGGFISKFVLIIACSAMGGIIGVNAKANYKFF